MQVAYRIIAESTPSLYFLTLISAQVFFAAILLFIVIILQIFGFFRSKFRNLLESGEYNQLKYVLLLRPILVPVVVKMQYLIYQARFQHSKAPPIIVQSNLSSVA